MLKNNHTHRALLLYTKQALTRAANKAEPSTPHAIMRPMPEISAPYAGKQLLTRTLQLGEAAFQLTAM
jgi:hypothetical protein